MFEILSIIKSDGKESKCVEGMVVGWAGTLLLFALAIMLFCLIIGLVSMLHGRSSDYAQRLV